jgi:peptide/nickel transport system substrate-binding protein
MGPEITGDPKTGGTLVYGSSAAADGLHPHTQSAATSQIRNNTMYESLVERDWTLAKPVLKDATPPPGPVPALATTWTLSDDKRTWTFNLREGVTFHDGTPFNAQAAEFNFRTMLDPDFEYYYPTAAGTSGFTLTHVESVNVVDDHTLEIRLKYPFFGFIDKLSAYPCCGMISPTAIMNAGSSEAVSATPVGTGPFKFVEWKRGERLEIERYDDYWGDKTWVDRLVIVPITDEAARVAALLAGDIDIAEWVSPDNLLILRQSPGFSGYARGSSGFYALQPNHREPPFSDQRVRRAVSLCFDRQKLADELLKGVNSPGAQIWGSAHAGHDPDGPQITDLYDPAEAKRLLTEAGYPDGFKTKMYSSLTGLAVPELVTNNFVVIQLRECGIQVELISLEWMAYAGYWADGIQQGEDIGMFTMGMGTGDIAGFDQYIHSSGWPPAGWSVGWYANDDVDTLIERAWEASTRDEYINWERQAHQVALEDYAYIPIIQIFFGFGVSDRVGGWTGSSDWMQRFNRAWLEY